MKAIKVIVDEVPESCYDCEYKIAYPVRFGCAIMNGRNIRNDPLWNRPDWCPLVTEFCKTFPYQEPDPKEVDRILKESEDK